MTTAVSGTALVAVASEVRAEAARQRCTQMQVAAIIGCGQSTVSRKLRGESEFTVPEIYALADAWDVPVSGLLPSLEALRSIRCFTASARAAGLARAS
jgi:transcriptional regulator with XRE-family HTH domain